jgi:hypothetical protein
MRRYIDGRVSAVETRPQIFQTSASERKELHANRPKTVVAPFN